MVDWSVIKSFIDDKSLNIQFVELDTEYRLAAADDFFSLESIIAKSTPRNASQIDFEDNYKAGGNQKLALPRDAQGNLIISRKPIQPVYVFKDLTRGNGSRNMNVSASLASPIDFDFRPPLGEVWELEKLVFGLDDVGLTDMGLFGGISSLTNGILISVKTKGQVYVIGNMRDNVDIAMMFPGQSLGQSGVLDTADGMYGALAFNDQIHLIGDNNDYIRLTVRDNVSGINIMRAMAIVRKVL